MSVISKEALAQWSSDMKEYINVVGRLLLHSYKYGGTKIHQNDIPSFEDMLRHRKFYTQIDSATDYSIVGGTVTRTYCNTLHSPVKEGTIKRVKYLSRHGVVLKKEVEFYPFDFETKSAHGTP